MKIRFDVKSEAFKKQLADLDKFVNRDLGRDAYDYFKSITPIRSGNARRKTKYRSKQNTKVIDAQYPYAKRLDEGYSDQARQGMSDPTIDYIEREYNKEVKRLNRRG